MKYCIKCGKEIDDNAKFCSQCGTSVPEQPTVEKNSNEEIRYYNLGEKKKGFAFAQKHTEPSKKRIEPEIRLDETKGHSNLNVSKSKNKGCLIVLAWVFFLPIMLIITIAKSKKLSKIVKAILIGIVVLVTIMAFAISNETKEKEAEALYNDINTSVKNEDYIQAGEQIDEFLDNYSDSEHASEMQKTLEEIQPKIDQAKEEEKAVREKEEKEAKIKKEEQNNIDLLTENTGLTKTEAEQVLADLRSVGVKSLTSCEKALGSGVDDLQSFRVEADGKTLILTIEKRKTYYIGYGSVDLYDATKGGVINQVTDYGINSVDAITYMSAAEDYIKQILKSPSTAEFPGQILEADQWSVGRYKNIVQVQSYVDSQNGFGAMIRSNFVVQMAYDTSSCLYINFDGEDVYGTYSKMSN